MIPIHTSEAIPRLLNESFKTIFKAIKCSRSNTSLLLLFPHSSSSSSFYTNASNSVYLKCAKSFNAHYLHLVDWSENQRGYNNKKNPPPSKNQNCAPPFIIQTATFNKNLVSLKSVIVIFCLSCWSDDVG